MFANDGDLLREFNSLEHACEFIGSSTKGNLTSACSGTRNYWHNYRWSYTKIPNTIIHRCVGRKKGTKDKIPRKKRTM